MHDFQGQSQLRLWRTGPPAASVPSFLRPVCMWKYSLQDEQYWEFDTRRTSSSCLETEDRTLCPGYRGPCHSTDSSRISPAHPTASGTDAHALTHPVFFFFLASASRTKTSR